MKVDVQVRLLEPFGILLKPGKVSSSAVVDVGCAGGGGG